MFKPYQEYNDKILSHLHKLGLCTQDSKKFQLYTLNHKQAFMAVEMELGVDVDELSILHDTDKLVTYGKMEKADASKLHKKYARHHFKNCLTDADYAQCVIDYECARFTKSDKPLNAYEHIMKFKISYYDTLKPSLQKLGLDGGSNLSNAFSRWNHLDKRLLKRYIDMNMEAISSINSVIDTYGKDETIRMFYAGDLN